MDAMSARLEVLESALEEVRAENRTQQEGLRAWKRLTGLFMGLTAAMFALLLVPPAPATAQTTVEQRVTALEQKLLYVSRVGRQMYFNAVNVHIRNGGTRTESANSLGNLIVGFNELRPNGGDVRTGSHNIVVGRWNNYSSYGGLVVGLNNTISGPFASVSGGNASTASGAFASVSGGTNNTASGSSSSVSGGDSGTAPDNHDWRAGDLFQDY